MDKRFMLKYSISNGGDIDEIFITAHNITAAKPKLLSLLKNYQKAIAIFEYVKNIGWVEKEILKLK